MNPASTRAAWVLLLLLIIGQMVVAQEDTRYILERTNVDRLIQYELDKRIEFEVNYALALQLAQEKGWSTDNLVGVGDDGEPIYQFVTNNAAATFTQTIFLRSIRSVNGDGMNIGLWEAADPAGSNNVAPLNGHQDFNTTGSGRVLVQEVGSGTAGSHATHVAGTLIGDPPTSAGATSRGMAPRARVRSYSSSGDMSEMATEAANGLLVSNHSYGYGGGWRYDDNTSAGCIITSYNRYTWNGGSAQFTASGDDPAFGRYSAACHNVDELCREAPMYLPVFSAGNYNNQTPSTGVFCNDQVRNGSSGSYVSYDPALHPAGNGTQTNTISETANAKNILTIGNLQADQTLNSSSSRGKTDDGRVKPDLCGKGTGLYSADAFGTASYGTKTGTSMSAPNVSGSLILLQELYEERNGNVGKYMTAASLKALAIHTATDLGVTGPDFDYGWGLLNANLAGQRIDEDAAHTLVGGAQTSRIIEDELVSNSDVDQFRFNAVAGQEFKVTLCWTDVEGASTSTHNSTTARLVNDLDLVIAQLDATGSVVNTWSQYKFGYNGSGSIFYGDNDVDNVRQRPFTAPANATYLVQVTSDGNLTFPTGTPTQKYSLIISGLNDACQYGVAHGNIPVLPRTYNASNNIVSEGHVSGSVNYRAGTKVTLKPGFTAASGSTFSAKVQGCTP